ncbi:hypothetical protein KC19_7G003900 [Ceratodon purpureus]|uniref:Galectin domain-containing protein n=1 Tax=Ceratodon purpureus TaxID=3225 RepID=A0A8T0H169_CERPU|nr:hypothetical protein KC19_7G003900 [Ceratodon purpureus]
MMRRHAAYFRLGTTEDDPDPNDDLWALHRKYNRVDLISESKESPGPGFCQKANQAVADGLQRMTNLKVTGRMTIAVIGLMFVIRFTILENPVETFSRVVSQERKENVKKFVVSLKDRFGASESKRWNSSLGLTKAQLEAYTLATNLSERYEPMIMPSMWDGWRRMILEKGPPAKMSQVAVDGNLWRWVELMESLNANDLEAQAFGSTAACPDSLSATSGSGLELMAETSVVYMFEVVFHGDGAPFILQSQPYAFVKSVEPYTERCPAITRERFLSNGRSWPTTFVDSLHPCSDALRKPRIIKPREELKYEDILVGHFPDLNVLDESWWFPFTVDQPFVLTMSFGLQGYHIRVDGNYVCSFLYNQTGKVLKSISAVRIGGDVLAMSMMANGLYVPKKSILIPNHLKTPLTALDEKKVEMLIGVTSGGIQFERRMVVRRTWAQYPEIRSGRAMLRFFVGLTRTKNMNRRIFKEANLFKDVVILPFVDGRSYSVLKTIAMCVFMIKYTQAPYLLKTEDDTFVRVDTVLPAVVTSEIYARGLLRASIEQKGLLAHKQLPWYSIKREWPWSSYPKFPRGPAYAISRDVAAFICRQYEDKSLELFRFDTKAMGNWVDLYQRQYLHRVNYIDDPAFLNKDCEAGYKIAQGQNSEQMLCLWKRLQNGKGPLCCNNLETPN